MIYKGLLILSWIYIVFGVVGIFRFKNMYARLLTSSKIDTVATITILIALIVKSGISDLSIRLLLIMFFIMITNPVSTHIISRSAYLNGIDITFEGNGFVAIIGESGSGKTTLLNIIGLLDSPNEGAVSFNDMEFSRDISNNYCDDFRSGKLGYVFQDDILLNQLTVEENILYPVKLKRIVSNEDFKLLNSISELIGIANLLDRYPYQLSRGQRQRVAIVRALINNPDVLLADEPTGNLDSSNSEMIFKLLCDVSQERLVIVATHNEHLARKYSSRVIKIRDGEVVSDETIKANKQDPQDRPDSSSPIRSRYRLGYLLQHAFADLRKSRGKLFKVCLTGMLALISVLFVLSFSDSTKNELNALEEHLLGKNLLVITENPESNVKAFLSSFTGRGSLVTAYDFIDDCSLIEEHVLRYDISPQVFSAKGPIYIDNITPIKMTNYFYQKIAFQGIDGNIISDDNAIILASDIAKELYGDKYLDQIGNTMEIISVYAKNNFSIVGINSNRGTDGKMQSYISENAMYRLALDSNETSEDVAFLYGPFNLIERKDSSLGQDGLSYQVIDLAFATVDGIEAFDDINLLDGVMPRTIEEAVVSIQFLEDFSEVLFGKEFNRNFLAAKETGYDLMGFIYEHELYMKKYNVGRLRIVGLFDNEESNYGNVLFTKDGYSLISKTSPYQIDVYVKDYADIDAVREVFAGTGFDVFSPYENYKDGFSSRFDFIRVVLYILSVVLVVLTVSVINTFASNNIKDSTKDIGLLRAIGATRSNIINLFLMESAIIGFLTVALTIVTGIIMMVIVNFLDLHYIQFLRQISTFSVTAFILITFLGIGLYVLSAFPAVLRTTKLTPKEAIYSP